MLPNHARVVIIGGGVIGCSIAYHLAKSGCTDVLLIEQNKLTSGSTWHAAGAVGRYRPFHGIAAMIRESANLYSTLERDTGYATGWRQLGSIRLATTKARETEYRIAATTARAMGIPFEIISPSQIADLVPDMQVDDVHIGAFSPADGIANPSDVTVALARGAQRLGVKIVEDIKVVGFDMKDDAIFAVRTTGGSVRCEITVNCAGIWGSEVARMAGVILPVQISHHQYFISDSIPGLRRHFPLIRDNDNEAYFKEEVGGLLVGLYDSNPVSYDTLAIPHDHDFKLLPEYVEPFELKMGALTHRFPGLKTTGIKKWFNGLESFTEDGLPLLGESIEVRRFFIANAFNAFGIASGGGAGAVMAHWILEGEPPFDVSEADIRRFGGHNRSPKLIRARTLESQGRYFAMRWPYFEPRAGRPLRRSPIYHLLREQGALFGEKFGWERPNIFKPPEAPPLQFETFAVPEWTGLVAEEHRACREAAALFDQSSFAKFLLVGPDARAHLNEISSAELGNETGIVTYSLLLNARGGIEGDLTITARNDGSFLIVTATGSSTHDFAFIKQRLTPGRRAHLIDVTSAYGCLVLAGPKARSILAAISESDVDASAFPYGAARDLIVDGAPVLALRVGFVGELAFELFVPSEYMVRVYESLMAAGRSHGLKNGGYYALSSLRIEKSRPVWGVDIGPYDSPIEAALGFAVGWAKPEFNGKDALSRQRSEGVKRRLATFVIDDLDVPLLGHEPIFRNGEITGSLTSGALAHTAGKWIGMGYLSAPQTIDKDYVAGGRYEVMVRGVRYPAGIRLRPVYDPAGALIRA